MPSQLSNPSNLWKSDQETYLFIRGLIFFFLCVNICVRTVHPLSRGCKSVRFRAYNVEFFENEIIIIAIIIKHWPSTPHPATAGLSTRLWVVTFWFSKLVANGPESDSISHHNCFLHEEVCSRTVCRCFNGKGVYLYVNSFLWVIGLVIGKAQIRGFSVFKVYY